MSIIIIITQMVTKQGIRYSRISVFDLPAAGSCRAGMMDFSGGFKLLQMIRIVIARFSKNR